MGYTKASMQIVVLINSNKITRKFFDIMRYRSYVNIQSQNTLGAYLHALRSVFVAYASQMNYL